MGGCDFLQLRSGLIMLAWYSPSQNKPLPLCLIGVEELGSSPHTDVCVLGGEEGEERKFCELVLHPSSTKGSPLPGQHIEQTGIVFWSFWSYQLLESNFCLLLLINQRRDGPARKGSWHWDSCWTSPPSQSFLAFQVISMRVR